MFSCLHTLVSPFQLDSLLIGCHAVIGKDESVFLRRVWDTFFGRKKVRGPRVLRVAYLSSLVENVAVLFMVTAFVVEHLVAVLFVVTALGFQSLIAVLSVGATGVFQPFVAVLFVVATGVFQPFVAVLFVVTASIFPYALLAVRSSSAYPSLVPVETVQRFRLAALRARLRHSCS